MSDSDSVAVDTLTSHVKIVLWGRILTPNAWMARW